MQFSLLKTFLFNEGWVADVTYQVKLNRWYYSHHNTNIGYDKDENDAIESLIEYLNKEYNI